MTHLKIIQGIAYVPQMFTSIKHAEKSIFYSFFF